MNNPPSSLKAGDTFTLSYTFDTADSSVTDFYNADPTINIYYGSATALKLQIGGYQFATMPADRSFISTQLWDNRTVNGVPTDYFGQSLLQQLSGNSPVDLGAGNVSFNSNFNAFDFQAIARRSDLITEMPPLSAYPSISGGFGFINTDTQLQTVFQIYNLSASISNAGAVPEPATWGMMIVGFGFVGATLRRRKIRARVAYG